MNQEASPSLDTSWLRDLPHSRMVFPESLWDRAKYLFWRLYSPLHPKIRNVTTALGIVWHRGRQDFLLGKVSPNLTLKEFITRLVARGYANHFVAWKDEGEVVSLRYVENFKHQYHLRVFADREVRAHYEYTPECHPIAHFMERQLENRRDEFLKMLGDTIVTPSSESFGF